MKTIILILFSSLSTLCFAQKDTVVLLVPMKSNMVLFDNTVIKMLNYNKVSLDTINATVQNLSINGLKAQFPRFSFANLKSDPYYSYLIDSLDILNQWNCFQVKKIRDSKGIEKILHVNDEGPQSKYYGRVLNDLEIKAFKELEIKYKYTYICFINKFETITRQPFSSETFFCLHFEIYDQNVNKIYGGKSYWSSEITKTMYSSVFTFYIQKAFDDYFGQIKKFIMLQ